MEPFANDLSDDGERMGRSNGLNGNNSMNRESLLLNQELVDVIQAYDQSIEAKVQEIAFLTEDIQTRDKLLKAQKEKLAICEAELATLRDSRNQKGMMLMKNQTAESPLVNHVNVIHSWSEYVKRKDKEEVDRKLLKSLIRKGIPVELRSELWQKLAKVHKYNKKELYTSLLKKSKITRKQLHEIESDALRTLPDHIAFSKQDSPAIITLKRILIAYSQRNPKIGYCQGLGMIAACLILNMEEVEAYWMLCSILENYLPNDYLTPGMVGLIVDLKVLDELVLLRVPELKSHFEKALFDLSIISMNWLMTIFVSACPLETVYHIWDVFLSEGVKILFCFAIALLKYHESELLKLKDALSLSLKLKLIATDAHHCNEVFLVRIIAMKEKKKLKRNGNKKITKN